MVIVKVGVIVVVHYSYFIRLVGMALPLVERMDPAAPGELAIRDTRPVDLQPRAMWPSASVGQLIIGRAKRFSIILRDLTRKFAPAALEQP